MSADIPRKILLITPNFDNNSLGRTYCLWLLCEALNFETRIVGVKGDRIWPALAGPSFAARCVLPKFGADGEARITALAKDAEWADVIIAVKPLPSSFGVALTLRNHTLRPIILDIDDPDIEARTIWRPIRERLPRLMLSPSYRSKSRALGRLKESAQDFPVMVSNPVLQRMYGGVIVPHVRIPPPIPDPTTNRNPMVRFIGSPGPHKGLDILRVAVGRLSDEGFRLGVTAAPPPDAKRWEDWYGQTTIAAGQQLVATADIIALPSLPVSWARAQLPAKLIDAMMHGRAVVASDIEPMRWALGEPDLMVPPGDGGALVEALRRLVDPDLRQAYGTRLRSRAVERFSVDASKGAFRGVVDRALSSHS